MNWFRRLMEIKEEQVLMEMRQDEYMRNMDKTLTEILKVMSRLDRKQTAEWQHCFKIERHYWNSDVVKGGEKDGKRIRTSNRKAGCISSKKRH